MYRVLVGPWTELIGWKKDEDDDMMTTIALFGASLAVAVIAVVMESALGRAH